MRAPRSRSARADTRIGAARPCAGQQAFAPDAPGGQRRCFGGLRFQHDDAVLAVCDRIGERPVLALCGGIGREVISKRSVLRRDTPLGMLANAPGIYDASLMARVREVCPPFPGIVHPGMAWRLSLLEWEAIEAALRRDGDGPVVVTGHSLGGGLATLAGLILHARGIAVEVVVTFGAPRVGDRAFAQAYPLPLIRFEATHDPVPLVAAPASDLRAPLPIWLRRLLFGAEQFPNPVSYRHAGQLVYLDPAGRIHGDDAALCRRRTRWLLGAAATSAGRARMLASHVIPSYARMLRRLRQTDWSFSA